MVTVTYNPDKHLLRIKGHAEYAEKGKDIICAAISTTFYSLANFLNQYDQKATFHKFEIADNFLTQHGVTTIWAVPKSEYEYLIDHDFCYALSAFEMIQSRYPECINLRVLQN